MVLSLVFTSTRNKTQASYHCFNPHLEQSHLEAETAGQCSLDKVRLNCEEHYSPKFHSNLITCTWDNIYDREEGEPLSSCPSFMTGNRISSLFSLNDHFVASMSLSLKLGLLEESAVILHASYPQTSSWPRRQTAQQNQSSEQTGWGWPDGDLEGASCQTFVKQTKQGYINLYKYEQGNWGWLQCDVGQPTRWLCRPVFLPFVLVKIPVCLPSWWERSADGAADSTDLDWVVDELKARWTTRGMWIEQHKRWEENWKKEKRQQ